MMRSIQNHSRNFFVKLLLGALAASFAVWGIGDMLRGGLVGGYALKAKGQEVSLQEYRDELGMRYNALRQVMGSSFTPEMANKLGLKQQVINDLQTGLLVQIEAKSLGLRIPESEILKTMRESEAFQINGKFSKNSFKQALRRAGISEQRYTDSLNKEFLSKLLLQNFSSYSPDLTSEAKLLYRLRNETRDVTFYKFIPKINEAKLPKPDDRKLADYYKSFGEQFRKPEYRKLAWVTITKDSIREGLSVEDETLKQLYDDKKDSLKTPEQREVSQLLYETKDEANKALALLKQGKSFAETIKEFPPQNEMLSLGIITVDALPKAARHDVMALKEHEVTQPIKTDFGWHLFRVEKIIPEIVPSFDSQRDKLKQEWLDKKIEDAIYDITVDIEDSLAANIPLSDIGKDLNLEVKTSDWLEAGSSKSILPESPDSLLEEGFKLQDETDSSLIEGKSGTYVLVSLAERKESYIPEISELGDKVEKAWKAKQLRDAKYNNATKLAKATAADKSKLNSDIFTSLKARKINRNGKLPASVTAAFTEIPPALRQAIFDKAEGDVTEAFLLDSDNDSYIMAKIGKINRPANKELDDAKSKEGIDKIIAELRKQYGENMLSLYINYLAQKYPVDINHRAIAQLSR